MAETLQGKVVAITGAGAGIGLGMARAFHAAGALVAMGDLRQDTVERAAADLPGTDQYGDDGRNDRAASG